jgi:acetylornithine deacetylase/succinyl-diaminopimelate desuccinylase-like protein
LANPEVVAQVLPHLNGNVLRQGLADLASINGTPLPPKFGHQERYATNRLALTEADQAGRDHIEGLMQDAGMETDNSHPLVLRGVVEGKDPTLPRVVIASHFDTVPQGDMFDGVVCVLGGIAFANAVKEAGVELERGFEVWGYTGEESSRFGFALFGSAGVARGLTRKELSSKDADEITIEMALGPEAAERVQRPLLALNPSPDQLPLPAAVIELHVEQGKVLEDRGIDLGIVEAIAAPVRYKAHIGDIPLEADPELYSHEEYLTLVVEGKADHSGATPMGRELRADGLLETAELALYVSHLWPEEAGALDIGDIIIEDQALNKIPGRTTSFLRLRGNSKTELEFTKQHIEKCVAEFNETHAEFPTRFDSNPVSLSMINKPDDVTFYEYESMHSRQQTAFELITHMNNAAEARSEHNVVATAATWTVKDGVIELGLDIRGIDEDSRSEAIDDIKEFVAFLDESESVELGEPLAGSGKPVTMDAELVAVARRVIDEYNIGSAITMFSAAGHDAQNTQRAGIPTVMGFIRSKDGVAHNPEADSSPEDLETGIKFVAAFVLELTT